MNRTRRVAACFVLLACLSYRAHAQVTSDRLAAAPSEPQNWLMYSGNYWSNRYSPLNQITPANVKSLKLQWVYQSPVAGNWQTTPIVVDGVMYITQRQNDVVALDAATGRAFWIYRYTPAQDRIVCCGANNRGLAILGDTLFMGTLDAQLIAIDARTGKAIWKTAVAKTTDGYSITHAPLVVKDKVIVGVGGGEYGIRGFIAAYNVTSGKEMWRFYTIPAPGELSPAVRGVLRSRRLETWRRLDLADRLVRSETEPDVLGRRQRRPGLQRGAAARRQSLHRFSRRARRGYGQAEMALPVHAARRVRLRLGADPGARRQLGRQQHQRHHLGQPQRQLLRDRPRHGTVSRRQAVRESELDERVR